MVMPECSFHAVQIPNGDLIIIRIDALCSDGKITSRRFQRISSSNALRICGLLAGGDFDLGAGKLNNRPRHGERRSRQAEGYTQRARKSGWVFGMTWHSDTE